MMKNLFGSLSTIEGKKYDAQLILSRRNDGEDIAVLLELRSKKTEESYLYDVAILRGMLPQDTKTEEANELLSEAIYKYINDEYIGGSGDNLLIWTGSRLINSPDLLYMLGDVIYRRQGRCDDEVEDEIINELDGVVAKAMLEHIQRYMEYNI